MKSANALLEYRPNGNLAEVMVLTSQISLLSLSEPLTDPALEIQRRRSLFEKSNHWSPPQTLSRFLFIIAVLSLMVSFGSVPSALSEYGNVNESSLRLGMKPEITVRQANETPVLEFGKPIERELVGGQAHSYRVRLGRGQYIRVVVNQRAIDVAVSIFSPDGKKTTEVDSAKSNQISKPVSAIALTTGTYRLEIRSLEKTAAPGRYVVKIEELRPATKLEIQRAADEAFAAAASLRSHESAESLQGAIEKYKESLSLSRFIGDHKDEANKLISIGFLYSSLGEKRKALDYCMEALPISRAVGDRDSEATTLNNIGMIYAAVGENQKALAYDEQALSLSRLLGDRAGQAGTLNNMGSVSNDLGERQKALDYYSQALALFRVTGDRQGEAVALNNIGEVSHALGEKQKALEYYNQALALYHEAGDSKGEGVALNNLGMLYDSLGDKQKALAYYDRALPLFRAVGYRNGEAVTLGGIAALYSDLGEKQKSLDYYTQALPILRAVEDRQGEAVMLTGMGKVYNDLGEKQQALDSHNQALLLFRAVGDREGEAGTLNNFGLVYDDLGEKQKALDFYAQALPLYRAVGDRQDEAGTLNNIALVYDDLGEKQKALDSLAQALSLIRTVGHRDGEARMINNIGSIYSLLGEKQEALKYYGEALLLYRAAGDRGGEASTLNNIGAVNSDLGESQKALDYYGKALPLYRLVGDRNGEALALDNIGETYRSLGEQQKALDHYSQALLLSRAVGDKGREAGTLDDLGLVYEALGEQQKALDYYMKALPLRRSVEDRSGEAGTLFNLASLKRRTDLTEALTTIEAAIVIVESLRTKVGNQKLRSSYFATMQMYYELYIDILMRLHKLQPSARNDATALQVSERARARSLLETLAEANADIRQGVDPELLKRERSLQQLLNGKAERRARLLNGAYTAAQASAAANEIDVLTSEYQDVETKIRSTSPRYAALTQPQPLDLKGIQAQLDSGTLLLEYSLGDEHSYLWLVSPTEVESFELPARKEIETDARNFYQLLSVVTDPQNQEMLDAASRLSHVLLGPVAAQLGEKRLAIVADGALQYLPFAALPDPASPKQSNDGGQPLVVRHEIVSLPSTSVLATLRNETAGRKQSQKNIAVLADPVFYSDDERVKTNSGQRKPKDQKAFIDTNLSAKLERAARDAGALRNGDRLNSLPGTRTEAEGIVAFVPNDTAMKALDFNANRELVTGGELSQYRYLHFATHGLLDSLHPELTAIVLSLVDEKGKPRDGYLRAHEIYNLSLPADLVVLSACETALGSEVKGEGLISLTRAFMYAGAPRVVASLWAVRDDSTAKLMVSFYRGMIKEKKRPADALRAAQIEMLKTERWQSPHYWAAFVLQGEWR
jgi:CHAT domain-containing protein/tetratricopeptide (TPR) repeat protein